MKVLFLVFLFLFDIATKAAAIHWIEPIHCGPYPFGGIPLFSFSGVTGSLNYVSNTGIAWGLFTNYPALLFALRVGIIAWVLFFAPKRFPVWLILTGAIGNALDYCLYAKVIDFIHLTFWGYSFPIFNVADACISIGVLSLLFFPEKKKQVRPS